MTIEEQLGNRVGLAIIAGCGFLVGLMPQVVMFWVLSLLVSSAAGALILQTSLISELEHNKQRTVTDGSGREYSLEQASTTLRDPLRPFLIGTVGAFFAAFTIGFGVLVRSAAHWVTE